MEGVAWREGYFFRKGPAPFAGMGDLYKKAGPVVVFFESFSQPFKTVKIFSVNDQAVYPGEGTINY